MGAESEGAAYVVSFSTTSAIAAMSIRAWSASRRSSTEPGSSWAQRPARRTLSGLETDVLLRAGWIDCAEDTPCTGAETYVRFDPELGRLTDEKESLFVTWYATAGELEAHRLAPTDPGLRSVENRWTASSEPGSVGLWAVLRDGRGGVGYAAHRILVR
jgi:hypothetical protein